MPQYPAHIDHSEEFGTSFRVASFNLRNCALPNTPFYENKDPYSETLYQQKTQWIAEQIDNLNADVIVFQEVFQLKALQEALRLSKTMKQAQLIGRDAVRMAPRNTWVPQVAIATRVRLHAEPKWVTTYGNDINITPPGYDAPLNELTRPVLHVTVALHNGQAVHVLGLHLKSKRPDYLQAKDESNPDDLALATFRSLMRRGADAVGLRRYLNDLLARNRTPCIVAGDFNDAAQSVTTQIIAGSGRFGKSFFDYQLFDAQRIQTRNDPLRNVVYSHIHDGSLDVLDHIFVSEEFHPHSRFQIAQVREVYCLNDHLHKREPHTSDHGQMVAQFLFKNQTQTSSTHEVPPASNTSPNPLVP